MENSVNSNIQIKRYEEYDLLRIILIILVVIGHSSYYNVRTVFGGIYYEEIMRDSNIKDTVFHNIVKHITSFIYMFHMPAFMALSGTIYYKTKKTNKKNEKFFYFVIKKTKRLLIPLIIVYFFWNFPLKYFTNYYQGIPKSKYIVQFFCPSSVYLWYLESLFFVFLIFFLIQRIRAPIIQYSIIIFLYCIGIIIFKKFNIYNFLGNPFYYLFWFTIGFFIEKKREVITKILNKKIILLLTIIGICLFIVYEFCSINKYIAIILKHGTLPSIFTVFLYYFVWNYQIFNKKIIKEIASYGLGIYLYAEPLNYVILYLFYKYMGITVFGIEFYAFLIWIIRIIITTLISVIITFILRN